jgi:integrase
MKNQRGSIDTLPSGRHRVRVPSGRGQITWGTFDTMQEAERELAIALHESDLTRRDYEGTTIHQLGDKIMTRREVKNEVRDPGSDRSRWDKHIKSDEIAKVAVVKLQPKHVYQWLVRLEDKGLSAQTVRHCRNLLSVVCAEACAAGTIKTNPVADVRMRGRTKKSAEAGWTYLVPAEQVALIEATPYPDRCLVAFAIGTGLRAGELVALRRVDVDIEGRRLMVRFGGPPDEPTKTGKIRPVPILGPALEAVKAWLRDVPEREGCPALFPRLPRVVDREHRFGGYRDPNHVIEYKVWKAALQTAGITRRVRWHDLRHTCASSLVSGWWGRRWSLHEVKDLLGHTTIDLTQRYAHLAPGALEEAAGATQGGQVTLVTAACQDPQLPDGSIHRKTPEEIGSETPGAGHEFRTRDLRLGKTEQNGSGSTFPRDDLDVTLGVETDPEDEPDPSVRRLPPDVQDVVAECVAEAYPHAFEPGGAGRVLAALERAAIAIEGGESC